MAGQAALTASPSPFIVPRATYIGPSTTGASNAEPRQGLLLMLASTAAMNICHTGEVRTLTPLHPRVARLDLAALETRSQSGLLG